MCQTFFCLFVLNSGDKAVVTDEKYSLNCELAFRSIGYRSVQVDPDIIFDNKSSTVPQNTGIVTELFFKTNCYD